MKRYESYKDSGVEWIEEVPSHWEVSSLGKILLPVSEKNRPDLPLLSITRELGVIKRDVEDLESNHNFIPDDLSNYKVLKKGQFGMNKMKAWQGSYGVSNFTGIVSPAYYIFDFIKSVNPVFFHWAIRSKIYVSFFGMASDGVRIGQWDLSKSRMKFIPFVIPSDEEQQKIAQYLDDKTTKIDHAISLAEKQIELLKEHKQILIQSAVTKGLDSNVEMKDSGVEWIGEVPNHWEIIPMKKLIKEHSGNGFPIESQGKNGNIPFLKVSDFSENQDKYIVKWNNAVSNQVTKLRKWNIVPKNSIVTAKIGEALRKNHRKILLEDSIIDNNCLGIEIKKSDLLFGYYLHCALDFDRFTNPGAVPSLDMDKYRNQKIALPPIPEQQKIAQYLDEQTTKIDHAISLKQQHIEKLKEYKSVLINDVVTGKVRV
ncbi:MULTISPECIES: restriction endonuclease subunit S [unclassified Pasteurella]|uniref:restriction endonuclease subunit S n=1 Tax=unclassified Pasteurella TaxID=2621516 RepID=UPI0010743D48|nr:restriction endonuclease subunit S [Pasteurella sp. 19428wF3_WM03]TFU51958.1 restriction endonuclease subunit S [Pasteurella sp. WM03]